MEGGKKAICIRGLKWTWRGREEVERKKGGEQGIKREGRKRRGSREEKRGSPGTGFVMLNCLMFSLSPPLSVDNTIVNHRGNRLRGTDLLRAGLWKSGRGRECVCVTPVVECVQRR